MDYFKDSVELHKKLKGKLEIKSKIDVSNREILSTIYTPGVAQPSLEISENPDLVYDYTIKGNSVAVVTDGSAVLQLGNIGAEASLPVMEGKAILFKKFADIDAFPIAIKSQDTSEIIQTVRNISPVFGAINLEDIASPRCFEVESALQDLGIPVMHDDQHGTAVVVSAALTNALEVVGKNLEDTKIVVVGAGAAGIAIVKTLLHLDSVASDDEDEEGKDNSVPSDVLILDSKGVITPERQFLNKYKEQVARHTNKEKISGDLGKAIKGADVFIGVSKENILSQDMVRSMAKDPIIFAMANPNPEIMPDKAKAAGARIVGTGRSDMPNQINNALAFPGIFRGALDAKATVINSEMKSAAINALASLVTDPNEENILPTIFDPKVVKTISESVKRTAIKTGVIRKGRDNPDE